LKSIEPLQKQLDTHPVYGAVQTLDDLRTFMSHHVFPVWDFMSLVKYLQGEIAPTRAPWAPLGNPNVRRFINELVIEEESDEAPPDGTGETSYTSHFELYGKAMAEVGASGETARELSRRASEDGFDAALTAMGDRIPPASSAFMQKTFSFIRTGKPHVAAAAFALGREHIIAGMFRAFLAKMNIDEADAPAFHYYLNRHVHLDEDFHGPLSLLMLRELCDGDDQRIAEAEEAGKQAIEARLAFWDGVLDAIRK